MKKNPQAKCRRFWEEKIRLTILINRLAPGLGLFRIQSVQPVPSHTGRRRVPKPIEHRGQMFQNRRVFGHQGCRFFQYPAGGGEISHPIMPPAFRIQISPVFRIEFQGVVKNLSGEFQFLPFFDQHISEVIHGHRIPRVDFHQRSQNPDGLGAIAQPFQIGS